MSNWHKNKWLDKAEVVAADTKEALQIMYDALNQGQKKKIVKVERVKALFDHHGVKHDE